MPITVCMLAQHHPFLDARIFKKEARSLVKAGYDVTLVMPRKNGLLHDIDGTPFHDRFLEPIFVHEGIRIVSYEDDLRHTVEQIVANSQAPRPTDIHLNRLTEAGLQVEADIYHAHEFLSLYAGACIKRELRARGKHVKLIYDSHEITPDPYGKIDPNRKVKLHSALLHCLQEVDHVITVSDAMKTWYQTMIPTLRVEVIYNSPSLSQSYVPKTYASPGLTVYYEGNIDNDRGSADKIIAITEGANKLMDLTFKIIGGVRSHETFMIPPHLQSKLITTGWVSYESIPNHMTDVDIGWIDYKLTHTLNHMFALPNKFFSCLSNGVPVIVNKCHEMERIIRHHRCGLVIDKPEVTADEYVQAIHYLHVRRNLLQEMSVNARKAMEEHYSWEKMEQRLFEVYKRVQKPNYLKYTMN
jgi:glycosyltransferase involved in cell wall biosynthesis